MARNNCKAGGSKPARDERIPDPERMLPEELVCAMLLAGMVLLMFLQAAARNAGFLARTGVGTWLAHATEVLPSGLTWLTFLGCSAVTRRRSLLRVSLARSLLKTKGRRRLDAGVWCLWGLFFLVLFVLGVKATYAQRRQMTSIHWLPAWAVALSVPLGAALVLWRTAQNLVDRGRDPAAGTDDPS